MVSVLDGAISILLLYSLICIPAWPWASWFCWETERETSEVNFFGRCFSDFLLSKTPVVNVPRFGVLLQRDVSRVCQRTDHTLFVAKFRSQVWFKYIKVSNCYKLNANLNQLSEMQEYTHFFYKKKLRSKAGRWFLQFYDNCYQKVANWLEFLMFSMPKV